MTRVMVTYSSKHGSTGEIAAAIADQLRERGLDVDCVDTEVASLAHSDAVVLGSAVYMGRWMHGARRFLKKHHDTLSTIPFWVFSSGPVGEKAAEDAGKDAKWVEPRRVLALAESAGMRGHIVFGGRIPQDPQGMVERSMLRNTPEEFQDTRDWDEIRLWADTVADELLNAPA